MVNKQITILVNGKSHLVEIEDTNSYPFEIYVDGKKMSVSVENTPTNQTLQQFNISNNQHLILCKLKV